MAQQHWRSYPIPLKERCHTEDIYCCWMGRTYLDHPVGGSCHKPFIARFDVNTTNPALVTADHLTQEHTHTWTVFQCWKRKNLYIKKCIHTLVGRRVNRQYISKSYSEELPRWMPDWFRHGRSLLWDQHLLVTNSYESSVSTAGSCKTFCETSMLSDVIHTCCRSTVVPTVQACQNMLGNGWLSKA